MKKKFLYFLTDELNRYYYVENNVLSISASPRYLAASPDGWMDESIQYSRNQKYHGINRSFTLPLKFVKDGAFILKNIYYKKSSETKVNLIISKLDNVDGVHKLDYRGEIDFSTFKDAGYHVEVTIMEGGLSKYLKAYENTTFELPMDVPEALSVTLDGMDLRQTLKYAVPDVTIAFGTGGTWHNVPIANTISEGSSVGVTFGSQDYNQYASATSPDVSARPDFLVGVNGSGLILDITGTIKVKPHTTIGYVLQYKTNTGRIVNLFNGSIPANSTRTIALPAFTLNDGESLFILGFSNSVQPIEYLASDIEIKYITRYKATTCKVLPCYYVFQQLISKITEGKYSGSSLLLASMTDSVLTCGDAIRSLSNAKIKLTLSSFYKWVDSLKMCGLGEDTLYKAVIETRATFYDNTRIIFNAGEVKDLEITTSTDLINNTIKVGYPDQKYDERNGRDEFNTTQQYKTPITRIVKEYDIVSPIRADMYGVEFYRINLDQKTTTDSGSDNDNFAINVKPKIADYTGNIAVTAGPSIIVINIIGLNLHYLDTFKILTGQNRQLLTVIYAYETLGTTVIEVQENVIAETIISTIHFLLLELNRPAYIITGLLDYKSAFNIEYSPKRMLIAHYSWIRSFLYGEDTKKITFQTTDKNSALVTDLAGVTITEKEDVLIGSMGDRIMIPRIFTFACALPFNVVTTIKANPYGYINFTWKGINYKGFVVECSHKPATNESQTIKVLSTPDNDLTTMING